MAGLPIYVGQTQGIWAKHGLDVQYTAVGDIGTLIPALGTTFDTVVSTQTLLISAVNNHVDVSEIAGGVIDTQENSVTSLLVGKGTGITDVSQLKGKTIGALSLSGTINVATLYWLSKNGVNPSDVKVVQVATNNQADQLASGKIQAVESSPPFQATMLAAGATSLGNPELQVGSPISQVIWVSQNSWISAHPDAVKNYVAALTEIDQFIKDNPDKLSTDIANLTKLPANLLTDVKVPTYSVDPRTDDFAKWAAAMKVANGFAGTVDTSKLVSAG